MEFKKNIAHKQTLKFIENHKKKLLLFIAVASSSLIITMLIEWVMLERQ